MTTGTEDLRIGRLAEEAGVAAKTIRYYEDIGVLPAPRRTTAGWRAYDTADVRRLRFVRGARLLGLSLRDVKEILAFRDRGEPPCRHVLEAIQRQIAAVDNQITALKHLRGELATLQRRGRNLPTDTVDMNDCVCHLIEDRAAAEGRGLDPTRTTRGRVPAEAGPGKERPR
ncbi:MAG: heavy metal-responsive transcriptional regulator [Anaerolineae bacterium]